MDQRLVDLAYRLAQLISFSLAVQIIFISLRIIVTDFSLTSRVVA
jgi:hypothetical protein